MPDPYATISQVDPAVQERLAGVLELRAADIQQQAMLRTYLSDVEFPNAARVLEVGCGTGAVTRALARWPGVAEVVGIDPSPVFLAKARELGKALTNASFEEADGRSAPFGDQSFDVAGRLRGARGDRHQARRAVGQASEASRGASESRAIEPSEELLLALAGQRRPPPPPTYPGSPISDPSWC